MQFRAVSYIYKLTASCLFVCLSSFFIWHLVTTGLIIKCLWFIVSDDSTAIVQPLTRSPGVIVYSTVVKFSKCLEERGETHNTVAFFCSFLPSFLIVPLVHVSQLPEKSPVHYMRNPSLDCYIAPRWLNPPGIVCCRSNGWIKINNAPLRLIRHWKFFFFFCYCRKMDVSY